MRRSDRPGLIYLGCWLGLLAITGTLVMLSMGTWRMIPALLIYSGLFAVSAYALSHECAHETAFQTRCIAAIPMPVITPIRGSKVKTIRCIMPRFR
ncbi:hypothetical protein RUE5091_04282 [Ruegeria denitrificans]|uniref:Fatty acid desaturase n=1 Tax=Ruegeria denitrificans TaxID=1715692 RepID=A0A0P1J0U3_9RHOB|nr:hypothetical protein [Ruegeria denitrificans]CUK18612.1 hypothetical protein RUE5091_04282 [Ruegeria denitrificans]